ncbi:MAG: DUF3710 domain-containing protein, partial [Micrococcales bacterium]|nr:DUF3710 domain-containing protein [Micrococcales bacterium]
MNDNLYQGPYDVSDVSAPSELAQFGAISFVPNGLVTVRAEVEDGTGKVLALSFDYEQATLQVQAFASPKGENIWHEVLLDIQAKVTEQGGTVFQQVGPFGSELVASILDSNSQNKTLRMFGFSGDRWLLRGT